MTVSSGRGVKVPISVMRPSAMRIAPFARIASPGRPVKMPSAPRISITSPLPPRFHATAKCQLGQHGHERETGAMPESEIGSARRTCAGSQPVGRMRKS